MTTQGDVDPAKIRRLYPAFPAGYEVTPVTEHANPPAFWGLGPDRIVEPPQCASLADPAAVDVGSGRGLAGSGPGGIIYVVVADSAGAPDPQAMVSCDRWTMVSGRTSAVVILAEVPSVGGALTLTMATTARTVVEGGTETVADASTAVAYLGDHVAFVTAVTDPGSPLPQLPEGFALSFLRKTVATVRS